MKKRYNNILFTSIVAVFAFVSVTYVSCIKYDKNPYSCDYHACQNGGQCYHAICSCPAGYDSTYCNTMWVDKYPGHWKVVEKIVGSNFPITKPDSTYLITIKRGGTATSILIDSFLNNNYYFDIPVQLTTSRTISFNPYFCPYNTTPAFSIKSGTGTLSTSDTSITGTYYREIQAQLGTERDTVNYTMTKR